MQVLQHAEPQFSREFTLRTYSASYLLANTLIKAHQHALQLHANALTAECE